MKINNQYRAFLDTAFFCIITYGFHKLWWWLAPSFNQTQVYQETANWLAHQVFTSSAWILEYIFSWTFETKDPTTFLFQSTSTDPVSHIADPASNILDPISRIPYPVSLSVVPSCSGLKQFFQITILFLLFPGPWKHKLWFIPASILIMHGVNILRIVILSFVLVYYPDSWHFIHDWILRPFFYVIIFLEWLIWVHYFRNKNSLKVSKK